MFISGFINNYTAKHNQRALKIIAIEKSENIRYRTGYVKFDINGKVERFDVKKDKWSKIKSNDTLILDVGRGILGYDYVFKINKNEQK